MDSSALSRMLHDPLLQEMMDNPAAAKAAILSELARRSGSRSFAAFVKQAWPYVPQADPLVWSWHMDALCDHMEEVARGGIRKLLINIPPGHAKSIIVCVLFPAWVWTWWPKCQFLCASYSAALSVRDSLRCRAVIESDWYRGAYSGPKQWTLRRDQNAKHWFVNTRGGERFSTGIGGVGRRAHIILIDDPLDASDRSSEAVRKTTNDWIGTTLSQRFVDARQGRVCMIMQRLHQDDPSGHVLKGGDWQHLMLPSLFEPKRRSATFHYKPGSTQLWPFWQDPREVAGQELFPQRFPCAVLEDFQKPNQLGARGFAEQHQQRPEPAEGNLFKRAWWRFWKPEGTAAAGAAPRPDGCLTAEVMPAIALPQKFTKIIITVDANFKKKKDADRVSILTIAEFRGRRFVINRRKGPFGFLLAVKEIRAERKAIIERFHRRPDAIVIELAANGDAIVETLQEDFPEVVGVTAEGGKLSRAEAVSPQIESGNYYLPEGADWIDDYVHELAVFPNGSHDDDVDSTSQGLTYLSREGPDLLTAFQDATDAGNIPGMEPDPELPRPPRLPPRRF